MCNGLGKTVLLSHPSIPPSLLRHRAARLALEKWDTETGIKSQRLAKLLPAPIHSPSLVQHTTTDSCWGAGINRGLDFDKASHSSLGF